MRLKLTLAYDGTRYAGWQTQRRGKGQGVRGGGRGKPTIQETLESALKTILQEEVKITGSGRTDAGVHALAQVAHLSTGREVSPERLLRSLNQLLPADISVLSVSHANGSFHARFDAIRKRYRYRIFTGKVLTPFIRPYVYRAPWPLNVARMRREIMALPGTHDFRAFARAGSVVQGSSKRRILKVSLKRRAQELLFEIEGTGFLHTMVRSLVGTLMDVGRGRLPSGTLKGLLKTGSREGVGTIAPALGLTLVSVSY